MSDKLQFVAGLRPLVHCRIPRQTSVCRTFFGFANSIQLTEASRLTNLLNDSLKQQSRGEQSAWSRQPGPYFDDVHMPSIFNYDWWRPASLDVSFDLQTFCHRLIMLICPITSFDAGLNLQAASRCQG